MEPELFQDKYRVKSARLAGYDYGQNGAYFFTICTHNKARSFGEIVVPNDDWDQAYLRPTELAAIVLQYWGAISQRFPFAQTDAFILMPDHLHGVLVFDKIVEEPPKLSYQNKFGPQRENLAAVLRGFKAGVTSWTRSKNLDFKWQAGFHDRVIRNATELEKIRHYIATNPSRWQHEQFREDNLYR